MTTSSMYRSTGWAKNRSVFNFVTFVYVDIKYHSTYQTAPPLATAPMTPKNSILRTFCQQYNASFLGGIFYISYIVTYTGIFGHALRSADGAIRVEAA